MSLRSSSDGTSSSRAARGNMAEARGGLEPPGLLGTRSPGMPVAPGAMGGGPRMPGGNRATLQRHDPPSLPKPYWSLSPGPAVVFFGLVLAYGTYVTLSEREDLEWHVHPTSDEPVAPLLEHAHRDGNAANGPAAEANAPATTSAQTGPAGRERKNASRVAGRSPSIDYVTPAPAATIAHQGALPAHEDTTRLAQHAPAVNPGDTHVVASREAPTPPPAPAAPLLTTAQLDHAGGAVLAQMLTVPATAPATGLRSDTSQGFASTHGVTPDSVLMAPLAVNTAPAPAPSRDVATTGSVQTSTTMDPASTQPVPAPVPHETHSPTTIASLMAGPMIIPREAEGMMATANANAASSVAARETRHEPPVASVNTAAPHEAHEAHGTAAIADFDMPPPSVVTPPHVATPVASVNTGASHEAHDTPPPHAATPVASLDHSVPHEAHDTAAIAGFDTPPPSVVTPPHAVTPVQPSVPNPTHRQTLAAAAFSTPPQQPVQPPTPGNTAATNAATSSSADAFANLDAPPAFTFVTPPLASSATLAHRATKRTTPAVAPAQTDASTLAPSAAKKHHATSVASHRSREMPTSPIDDAAAQAKALDDVIQMLDHNESVTRELRPASAQGVPSPATLAAAAPASTTPQYAQNSAEPIGQRATYTCKDDSTCKPATRRHTARSHKPNEKSIAGMSKTSSARVANAPIPRLFTPGHNTAAHAVWPHTSANQNVMSLVYRGH